ncbi:MAG TPA: hypothetical protein VLH56_03905 [Dissulfurispiraceae bacterium]|nr:hypothetical protein [Dissulfurispiraceae bacterium]
MTRFEEVQMRIAESARNFLDIYNMQVFIEQFTLDRESRFFVTLPQMEQPYTISAVVSFLYDTFQTSMSIYKQEDDDELPYEESSLTLEFLIKLPMMTGYPDIDKIFAEIEQEFPDTEPSLLVRETISGSETTKEYEIAYAYDIADEDMSDVALYEEIFEELREMLELVHNRTKFHIDSSWYNEEDDPPQRY